MPIRLLLTNGHRDDMPCTMPSAGTASLSNYCPLASLECLFRTTVAEMIMFWVRESFTPL